MTSVCRRVAENFRLARQRLTEEVQKTRIHDLLAEKRSVGSESTKGEIRSGAEAGIMKTCALVSMRKVQPENESLMVSRQESNARGLTEAITRSPNGHFPTPMHKGCDNCMLQTQSTYENSKLLHS